MTRLRLTAASAMALAAAAVFLTTATPDAAVMAGAGQTPPKTEKVSGYVEWKRDGSIIADGQRITWDATTKLKIGRLKSPADAPLGFELSAAGVRTADGALLARELSVKNNGDALYEAETRESFDALEQAYVQHGSMFQEGAEGKVEEIGAIRDTGRDVERVRTIAYRLLPSYIPRDRVRVRIVDVKNDWNAMAMDNGALWVYSALERASTDDELAIVIGHEIAHFTHEHGRRKVKNAMITSIVAAAATAILQEIKSPTGQAIAAAAAGLGLSAWSSNYSRDEEDQADRVGLRYAYEARYNVSAAPKLWEKFRTKYGEADAVTNFFQGDHSRPSDRIRNLQREIDLNYRGTR